MEIYGILHYNHGQHPKQCSCKACEKDRKRRSCEEKTPYDTELDAYRAAQRRNRECPIRYSDIGHYKCDYCARWHIGHSNNGDLRSKKAMRLSVALADIHAALPMVS